MNGKMMLAAAMSLGAAMALDGEPLPENVPPLMTMANGAEAKTVADWEGVRRPEILELFRRDYFGRRPVQRPEGLTFELQDKGKFVLAGHALRQRVKISWKGVVKSGSFTATAYFPLTARPVPVFIYCNLQFPEYVFDRDVKGAIPEHFPVDLIISRGYGAVIYDVGEVQPDRPAAKVDMGKVGLYSTYSMESKRPGDAWGCASMWSWAASRILDWLETESRADARRVAFVGHSRGGKTALWGAAEDPRFAMACSNDSGTGGAKLTHMKNPGSCPLAILSNDYHGIWFAPNIAKFAGKDMTAPLDMHMLIALIAPRLVCVASATKDTWSAPRGEYWAARLASPAWEVYGKKGLVTNGFPKPDTAQQEGCVSYHLRAGKHHILRADWKRYLDFADRNGWNRPAVR